MSTIAELNEQTKRLLEEGYGNWEAVLDMRGLTLNTTLGKRSVCLSDEEERFNRFKKQVFFSARIKEH